MTNHLSRDDYQTLLAILNKLPKIDWLSSRCIIAESHGVEFLIGDTLALLHFSKSILQALSQMPVDNDEESTDLYERVTIGSTSGIEYGFTRSIQGQFNGFGHIDLTGMCICQNEDDSIRLAAALNSCS